MQPYMAMLPSSSSTFQSDADRLAAEKHEADKKAAEDAAAIATAYVAWILGYVSDTRYGDTPDTSIF